MSAADGAEFCTVECLDGIFIRQIEEKARTITRHTVIVTHQMGSHGPSYWLRYPAEAAAFQPACETDALAECPGEKIVNAYDNTIRYTDAVLAQTIDLLEASDRVIPALYYVSDHGESLGEGGLYLHGAPAFMAPEEQTHVPMVIWMSERFRASLGVDQACLAAGKDDPVSHDNLFSTVLGLLDVTTSVRDPALDLAGPCRTGATG
jgi:lipid A ethanolaminephosphotransferase